MLCATGAALAYDGVTLLASQGLTSSEVRLDWSRGQPVYAVYRSDNPAALVLPQNQLGETSGLLWLDAPPRAAIGLYRVVGPCLVPTAEVCDGVDDDCDGLVDDGLPADSLEPNNSCEQVRILAGLDSDQMIAYSPSIYPAGDVDHYRVTASETNSTCACGIFSTEEDYSFVTTLTVPGGAGSCELCVSLGTCSFGASSVPVEAGATQSLTLFPDGTCPGNGPRTDAGPGQPSHGGTQEAGGGGGSRTRSLSVN